MQEIVSKAKNQRKRRIHNWKKEMRHFSKVYDEMGYEQPEVVDKLLRRAGAIKKDSYLWIGNHLSDWPMSEPRGRQLLLKIFHQEI